MSRLETEGDIMEVLINEDLLHPEEESISLCFRGRDSSGIVNLTPKELNTLNNTIHKKMHLIKGFKKIQGPLI